PEVGHAMVSAPDLAYAAAFLGWILFLSAYLTRKLYERWTARGMAPTRAVYFNRKIIHILAGGLVAISLPLFSSWAIPVAMALLLSVFLYIPRRTGRLMYWFQTPDNAYEIHFTLSWALIVFLTWAVLGDLNVGIAAISFMAFGDAATGIVRNALFGRRTKSWWGNLAMAAVSIPIGYIYAGPIGALAGAVASVVEHFEWPPVDDNVTVPVVSFVIMLLPRLL
ncbi:MAG: dolichol kinase, partial [Thermoproteus sp.]